MEREIERGRRRKREGKREDDSIKYQTLSQRSHTLAPPNTRPDLGCEEGVEGRMLNPMQMIASPQKASRRHAVLPVWSPLWSSFLQSLPRRADYGSLSVSGRTARKPSQSPQTQTPLSPAPPSPSTTSHRAWYAPAGSRSPVTRPPSPPFEFVRGQPELGIFEFIPAEILLPPSLSFSNLSRRRVASRAWAASSLD
jgi:hypothetical protein